MAESVRRAAAIAFFLVLSGPSLAQWDPYPSAGVPLTADGEPDLAGPTPRTFDGRPDFSGIWEHINGQRGPVQGQLGRGPNVDPPPGSPPVGHFFDLGAQFDLPYTEWGDQITQERIDDAARGNPDAYCLPMGPTQFHMHPQPRKIIQTRDLIAIVNEVNSGFRQIFLDGRPLPDENALPWWFGYSVGHWEGDTLVVDVTNFTDNTWVVGHGAPPEGAPATSITTGHGVFHSEDLHVVERYTLADDNTIHYEATITDPQVFTQSWTISYDAFNRAADDHILYEYACHEGNARNLKLMTGTDTEARVALEHVPR